MSTNLRLHDTSQACTLLNERSTLVPQFIENHVTSMLQLFSFDSHDYLMRPRTTLPALLDPYAGRYFDVDTWHLVYDSFINNYNPNFL